jgi:predicted nucleic acid-binding protein
MSRIYWDSMVFVYWVENHPAYSARVEHIFKSMLQRGDRLCASYLCMGEVLTGPLKHKHAALAAKVRQLFGSGGIDMLPFDRKAADLFAELRAISNVTPADAIHLACAGAGGVDLFLTHDTGLHKLRVPGIQFIAGLDVNVF